VYYFVLRRVLRAKAYLRPLLKRCRHCRIFFFTDPRNRGRVDLGCPFGCKDAHRRRCSSERSADYNTTPVGKLKKKQHNGKRGREPPEKPELGEESQTKTPSAEGGGSEFDPGVVKHVRVVTSLIEGRQVSQDEVLEMLTRAVRQHSLAREMPIDYVLRALKENPEKPP
jgi:hypothetical protein